MTRFTTLRMPALALAAAAMTFGTGVSLAVSASAEPQPYVANGRYDGYCYVKKSDLAGKDAAIGAAAGALAGGLLGKKGDKTKTAVIGGAVGGVAGYVVGKNSNQKIRCRNASYYVYNKGFYEPSARPDHRVVYFEDRPAGMNYYYITSKGKVLRYKG